MRALRAAGLDDPGVLLNYPRYEEIKGPGLAVPSGAASPEQRSTSACDLTVTMPSSTATGSASAASAACGWTLVTDGDPKTDHAFSVLGGDPKTSHASFMPETGGDPRNDHASSTGGVPKNRASESLGKPVLSKRAATQEPAMLPCV